MSPDLTICDFRLWSHVEDQVFRRDYQSLHDLSRAIEDCLTHIPQRMVRACYRKFVKRRSLCVELDTGVSKHLL